VPRSNPSAMLLETETAARSIWSRRLRWRRKTRPEVSAKTARPISMASFQTGSSSKREYFMAGLTFLGR